MEARGDEQSDRPSDVLFIQLSMSPHTSDFYRARQHQLDTVAAPSDTTPPHEGRYGHARRGADAARRRSEVQRVRCVVGRRFPPHAASRAADLTRSSSSCPVRLNESLPTRASSRLTPPVPRPPPSRRVRSRRLPDQPPVAPRRARVRVDRVHDLRGALQRGRRDGRGRIRSRIRARAVSSSRASSRRDPRRQPRAD